MVLLAVSIAIPMGIFTLVANERLEHDLLRQLVSDEADFVLSQLEQNPDIKLPQTNTLIIWLDAENHAHAPEPFHSLAMGKSHDIHYLQNRWHVQKKETALGVITAAYDVSHIEEGESVFRRVMGSIILLAILFSLALGHFFARRLASPLANLSLKLGNLSPDDDELLAPLFRDQEMYQIAVAADELRAKQKMALEREKLFTAAVSHELRTPIATINSSLELLDIKNPTLGKQATFIRAQRASQGLADMVTSLLFIARERQPKKCSEFNVAKLASDCLNTQRTLCRNTEIDWQLINSGDCLAAIDATHLRVLIINLLRNAMQHTEQGRITLTLQSNSIEVSDTGEGLPNEPLEKLLQPYVSGPQKTGQQFGLGLYIVQSICSHYGWELRASANTNGGCRMTLYFDNK
jgi:signal transduction histidine kinase